MSAAKLIVLPLLQKSAAEEPMGLRLHKAPLHTPHTADVAALLPISEFLEGGELLAIKGQEVFPSMCQTVCTQVMAGCTPRIAFILFTFSILVTISMLFAAWFLVAIGALAIRRAGAGRGGADKATTEPVRPGNTGSVQKRPKSFRLRVTA